MSPRKLPLWRSPTELTLVDAWSAMGLSLRSIQLYLAAVRRADAWCELNGYELATLPTQALIEYAETLPRTWASRRRLRSALTAYWNATGRPNPPVRAIRVPSKPRMRPRALDEPAAHRLAREAEKRNDQKGLAVLFGLYLGLRRAEIAGLRWSDFDSKLTWVRVVGKGDITADLPVHPVLTAALRSLAPAHPVWVFPGRVRHVTPTTIWGWVRDVAEDAQLGPIGAHVLRHTCLTTANDATGDLRAVQMLARHARPETTAGYTRVSTKRMISVMLSLDYSAPSTEATA